ncbi:MAG: thioredoxin family protein [Acidobacteriota bacterium]|nr:thioredoxin family protein [Acidobacteriota bacterium]
MPKTFCSYLLRSAALACALIFVWGLAPEAAALGHPPADSDTATQEARSESSATLPAIPESGWVHSLHDAQELAQADDKKILVNLYASWCGWCRRLDQQVFASQEFEQLRNDFVMLKLDVEEHDDGPKVQRRYGTRGVPVTLLLTSDLDRVTAISGFLPKDKFLQRVEQAVTAYDDRQAHTADRSIDLLAVEPTESGTCTVEVC